jgi:hypothetical protein
MENFMLQCIPFILPQHRKIITKLSGLQMEEGIFFKKHNEHPKKFPTKEGNKKLKEEK